MDGITFLKTVSGSVFDVCNEFYFRYLKNEKDKKTAFDLFKHLISKDILTNRSYPLEKNELSEDYFEEFNKNRDLVNQAINNLIEKGVTEEEFYSQLWNSFFENILFDSDKDKINILLCLAINPKIPYYQPDKSIEMISKEEFAKIIDQHFIELQKAEFIMNMDYEDKTVTSSQLIALLNSIHDEKAKAVVLAGALSVLYDRITTLIDILHSMNAEDEDEPEEE